MARQRAEYPFDDYYLHVVYHKGEGRRYANLVPIDKTKHKRRTTSYARYLMSIREGRFLTKDEEVDHIDNNKLNDDIDNLQILTPEENRKKAEVRVQTKMAVIKCPHCGKIFEKPRGNTHLVKGGSYTSCSRHCNGKIVAALQKNPNDEYYLEGIRTNVLYTYKKPMFVD